MQLQCPNSFWRFVGQATAIVLCCLDCEKVEGSCDNPTKGKFCYSVVHVYTLTHQILSLRNGVDHRFDIPVVVLYKLKQITALFCFYVS